MKKILVLLLVINCQLLFDNSINAQSVSASVISNINCFGGNNGIATSTPSGGTSPYTYFWAPVGDTLQTASNLIAGTYTILLTDNIGGTATATVTITQPVFPLETYISSQTNPLCYGGTGSATAAAAVGGTAPPYLYSWAPSGGTNLTASNLTAGTYVITVTDSRGCITTDTAIITQPAALTDAITILSNVSCNGENNGSTLATLSGGVSPYSYSWMPGGQTTASATGLTAGTYTITVTDSNGCTKSNTAIITQPAALSVSANVTANVSCNGGSNGTVSATPSGGTSPYTYSWLPGGQTTATVTGLSAGTYSVIITDNNNCVATNSANITEPNTAFSVSTSVTNNVSCNGGTNGSALATPSGGTSPYTYSWSPGGQTTATATGLSARTYTLTATDNNGCSIPYTITITQPAVLSASTSVTANVTCNGGNNGSASVSVSGGTQPYAYLWNDANSQTTAYPNSLSARSYTVTVTDSNSCTTTASVTITQPAAISISLTASAVNICPGSPDTLKVSGGTKYIWSTGDTVTRIVVRPVYITQYNVTVTNSNGCSANDSVTINVYAIPSVSIASPDTTICTGNSDTLTATGALSYIWSTGATTSSIIVSPASTTIYSVYGAGTGGCRDTVSYTLNVEALPAFYIYPPSQIICIRTPVLLSAYTANSYLWSNSATTSSITVSPATTTIYSVTGTIARGCKATTSDTITVVPIPPLVVSASASTICSNSRDTLKASGASTYSWSTGATTSSIVVRPLTTTTYSVTGFSTYGCDSSSTFTVNVYPGLSVASSPTAICVGGSAVLSATGSSHYTWSTGATTSSITVAPGSTTFMGLELDRVMIQQYIRSQ